jgi:hypothetical protein
VGDDFQVKLGAFRSYKERPKMLGKFYDEIFGWDGDEDKFWVKDLDGEAIPLI